MPAAGAPARRKLTCPACAARRVAGLPALERTLGFEVIDWLEAMLVHGPGDVQGEPYRLDDELKHVLLHLYELDAHGRRVVRRGFLSRPKGRSKTELAGAVSAAELCGPVRFDGNNARGQPIGRPVKGAQVVAYATEEGQAGTTYSTAAFMLGEGPAAHEYGLDVGLSRTYLEGGGVMLAETSGAVSAEGGRTTFAVFDETGYWATRELRKLHATVRRNLGKRAAAQAWSLETSAAWQPGEESVAEVLYRHWQALGSEGAVDPTIYVDHKQAPEVPDLDDDDELEAALRHVYGPAAAWLDLPRIMAEIRDPQTDAKEARRFWLNQPSVAADAWLEPELVTERRNVATPELGVAVTLGFDGSLSDDATALMACTLGDDPRLLTLGVWEPELAAGPAERAGWVVDVDGVDAAVADAFEDYVVVLMYCDPAYWSPHIAAWAARHGAQVVREFSTARDGRIVPASVATHTALTTGELEHDGNPALERHLKNARTRSTRYGLTLRKDRPKSPNKIDAAMAGVLAFQARIDAIAGELEARVRRPRHRPPDFVLASRVRVWPVATVVDPNAEANLDELVAGQRDRLLDKLARQRDHAADLWGVVSRRAGIPGRQSQVPRRLPAAHRAQSHPVGPPGGRHDRRAPARERISLRHPGDRRRGVAAASKARAWTPTSGSSTPRRSSPASAICRLPTAA